MPHTHAAQLAQLVLQLAEQIASLSERVDQLEREKQPGERVYAGRPSDRRTH